MSIDLTEGQLREVAVDVADSYSGAPMHDTDFDKYEATRDALADNIETLSEAHHLLNMLFDRDLTISQAMEVAKCNTSMVMALRKLRKLTEQCDKAMRERIAVKEDELAEEEAEAVRFDQASARAA